jgi:hypothetical protein
MKRLVLLAIGATFFAAVLIPAIAAGRVARPDASRLTPARSLVGTWSDFVPVAVVLANNGGGDPNCPAGWAGVIKEKFTLMITAGRTANQVIVHELEPVAGHVTLTKPCAAAAMSVSDQGQNLTTIAGFARPYAMLGTVSSNRLTLSANVLGKVLTIGSFSFTTDLMSGTWSLTMPLEGAVFKATTARNAIKLTRKR